MRHTLMSTGFYIITNCPKGGGGLAPLNKTPLCQYAAAASEMPYSNTWPSMGVCALEPQDGGGMFFKGINLTSFISRMLTVLELFVQ